MEESRLKPMQLKLNWIPNGGGHEGRRRKKRRNLKVGPCTFVPSVLDLDWRPSSCFVPDFSSQKRLFSSTYPSLESRQSVPRWKASERDGYVLMLPTPRITLLAYAELTDVPTRLRAGCACQAKIEQSTEEGMGSGFRPVNVSRTRGPNESSKRSARNRSTEEI